tara:strand:- start:215 stop:589 length:375 start_codon:yes stop_codon:yes gene_type:complete
MEELYGNWGQIIMMGSIFIFGLLLIYTISLWKIFNKCNQPGWSVLIPFYHTIIFLRIIEKPWYWLFLLFIPYVNIVFHVWRYNLLSKSFGNDEGFTVGLVFLPFIFFPILGFGKYEYQVQRLRN